MMIVPILSLTLNNSNTITSTVVVLMELEDDETHQSIYCCETES